MSLSALPGATRRADSADPVQPRAQAQPQVLDVADGLVDQRGHVVVVQGVDDPAPVTLADDQPDVAQEAQLMGDGRLLHPHGGDQLGHRPGSFTERRQDVGAAASPDLTILPVFLAATTAGAGAAIVSPVAFAVVTITTIVALTLLATIGGYGLRSHWLERWGNAFTALVLVVVGALVLTGTI
jgi:hypothetical protein